MSETEKPRRARCALERRPTARPRSGAGSAFVIALVVIGGAVGTKTAEQDEGGPGESGRADKTLHDAFPKGSDESVLVQSGRYTAGDPQFRAAVRDAMAAVDAQPHVREVESPYRSGDISDDRHSALVNFEIAGKMSDAEDRVGPVTSAVEKRRRAPRRDPRRAVRRGERGQGAVRPLRGGLPEGGVAVAAVDAADPDRRVRRAGRGGDPAAAGRDRGGGDDRPDRADLASSSRWTRRSRPSCC